MKKRILIFTLLMSSILFQFQNCSDVSFTTKGVNGIDDDLTPLVSTVGVVTILLALGDQLDNQLVIKGGSSQLIAETMVRYSSPVINPKILVVRDRGHAGETAYDSAYIANTLLVRYNADFIEEPEAGLSAADVQGYDLIWFNNPGHPMSNIVSKQTLMQFDGGVVLSGDDMARGNGFDMSDLTGLNFIDNGTMVICNGNSYAHDNNSAYQYTVGIVPGMIPGAGADLLNFSYGNDIDNTSASSAVEVIAYAVGGGPDCTAQRPTVVRYAR